MLKNAKKNNSRVIWYVSCDWTNSADLPQFTFNQYHRHLLVYNRWLGIFAHAHDIAWNLSLSALKILTRASQDCHWWLFTANFPSNLFTRDGERNSSHQWYTTNRVSSKRINVLLSVRYEEEKLRNTSSRYILVAFVMFTCVRINVHIHTGKNASLFYLIKCTICPKASSSSSSLIMIILDSLIEIVFISRTLAQFISL